VTVRAAHLPVSVAESRALAVQPARFLNKSAIAGRHLRILRVPYTHTPYG